MTVSVRAAALADVPAVVAVHESAFPDFFLTSLGRPFLRAMYRGFLSQPGGVLLVAELPGSGIVGLLAGSSAPTQFFKILRRRQGLTLGLYAVPGMLSHPLRVGERLWAALRYRGDRPVNLPGYWLLSSLGVAAGHSGRGIGAALAGSFCASAQHAQAPGVYLLTDQDNNEAALRFYSRCEFVSHGAQLRPGGRKLLILARHFSR